MRQRYSEFSRAIEVLKAWEQAQRLQEIFDWSDRHHISFNKITEMLSQAENLEKLQVLLELPDCKSVAPTTNLQPLIDATARGEFASPLKTGLSRALVDLVQQTSHLEVSVDPTALENFLQERVRSLDPEGLDKASNLGRKTAQNLWFSDWKAKHPDFKGLVS